MCRSIFAKIQVPIGTQMSSIISGVTKQKFTKFLHDVATSSPLFLSWLQFVQCLCILFFFCFCIFYVTVLIACMICFYYNVCDCHTFIKGNLLTYLHLDRDIATRFRAIVQRNCKWYQSPSWHFPKINWLPWQFPLINRKTRYRSIICIQSAFIQWKDQKNQSSQSCDIRLNTPVFCHVVQKVTNETHFLSSYALLVYFFTMSIAILVSILDQISWFFTKWKVFSWIFSILSSFSDSWRDVAMATNFVSKLPTPCTYHSECGIATSMD